MRSVILYGIRGTGRKEIEFYLGNTYKIVGYSDSDGRYQGRSHINYIRFFKPEELKEAEFDYVIITSKNIEISREIKQKLQRAGIKEERILQYALFSEVEYPHPYEIFQEISLQFRGFAIGMSHAKAGVDINIFREHMYNFSFESNDLFDIFQLLNKLCKENDRCDHVEYCILELPYYIFNWDRSRSRSALRRMNSYAIMDGEENQYHNLATGHEDIIRQYKIYEEMFKEKKLYNRSVLNAGVYDIPNVIAEQDYKEISDIWRMGHTDTIEENIKYFTQIISLLKQINSGMKIYITIFPQNPRFYSWHKEIVEKAKIQFYDIINKNIPDGVMILDYFTLYENREEYFADDCHLNTMGRNLFFKELAERIGENIK